MRPFTLAEVAGASGAVLAGPGDLVLDGVLPLAEAGPTHLSFVTGEKYAAAARESRAGALLVSRAEDAGGRPAIVHPQPVVALAIALDALVPEQRPRPGIDPAAHVHADAVVESGVSIAPGAVVEAGAKIGARAVVGPNAVIRSGATVGDDSTIGAGAVIEPGATIGSRCRIGPAAVIGFEGFGYVWDGERHRRVPQIGRVVLEDEVEVGAGSCIDRAALSETRIGRGTKIDNLVQIGHNVVIGPHSILCAQVGIAGSVKIGAGVTLAGQAGIADHVTIEDKAVVTAQAGVARTVDAGSIVSGSPARPRAKFVRSAAVVDRLPELLDRIRALEKRLMERGAADMELTIHEILKLLPHRYPFLLVDRVIELEPGKRVVGIKNVTFNEEFFQGHFPGNPVMPGVLIVEAMAQTAALGLLAGLPPGEKRLLYLTGIDSCRFRRTVVPGDQLRIEMDILLVKSRISKCRGVATVDGAVCAEAVLLSGISEPGSR